MASRVLSKGLKIFVLLSACAWLIVIPVGAGPIDQNVSLELLLQYERNLLQESEKRTDLNPSDRFGSDPFKIFHLRDKGQFLIMLRNRSELLLADQSLKLLDRKTTPRSPTGWTLARISHQPTTAGAHLPESTALRSDKGLDVLSSAPAPFVSHAPCISGHLHALASRPDENCGLADKRFLFVAGELSGEIQLYEIRNGSLDPRGKIYLHGIGSIRDLIYVPSSQSLFLLDDFDRRLHQLVLAPNWSRQVKLDFKRKTFPLGAGPIQIRYQDNHLLINLLLEHTLRIIPLVQGVPDFSLSSRITHDGPIWDFDAVAWKDSLMIAAGGVENRPLNRLGGEFGYIDSYLFLYAVPRDRTTGVYRWRSADRHSTGLLVQQNLSELGVVTPKAVRFASSSRGSLDLWVSAFGSPRIMHFNVHKGRIVPTMGFSVPPGTTDFVIVNAEKSPKETEKVKLNLVLTNALFDRVYRLVIGPRDASYLAAPGIPWYPSKHSKESRIGEVLFFTTLMTPFNRSEGDLSRFTCEACHYEGTIDGRVHYTGRGHVFAATKPVRGLANNVPLFSRAGDKSLASMILAEFRVANQKRRGSFSIKVSDYPWLREIQGIPTELSPAVLRKAFIAFFVDFQHRPNPWRSQGRTLDRKALQGLMVFRERCEYCHQASISTRKAESLPFEKWQGWLEAEGKDLVWGAPFYSKTGILPYVYKAGARVPSLRRIRQKYPYFTNGSSRTLQDLLSRFRYKGTTAWHHYEPPSAQADKDVESLTTEEITNLKELLRFY